VSENGESVKIDVLLATATQPCLTNGLYATPETIAKAWKKVPQERTYFDENVVQESRPPKITKYSSS
jgi:hypothetical protein